MKKAIPTLTSGKREKSQSQFFSTQDATAAFDGWVSFKNVKKFLPEERKSKIESIFHPSRSKAETTSHGFTVALRITKRRFPVNPPYSTPRSFTFRCLSFFLCFSLIFTAMPFSAQQASSSTPTKPAAAPGASAPLDPGWPREVIKGGAKLVYYQPQLDEWKQYRQLTADVAFSLTPAGGKAIPGVASLTAQTDTDMEKRMVLIRDIQITSVRFPSAEPDSQQNLDQTFRQLFPSNAVTISLDRLLAGLEHSKATATPVAVKNDPPQIFLSKQPAILLFVDGEPVQAPIEKTKLEFVVNTNWDLFFDKSAKKYYLLTDETWMTATALAGPWAVTATLPKEMAQLPANQNWDDVKKAIPPTVSPSQRGPLVFFTSKPAELIQLDGEPVYSTIPGTQIVYATNTENDLFFHNGERYFYYLVSGRWFKATQLEGPWSYASAELPADFKLIPPNHPLGYVLASVPGTREADDAVILAQIPSSAVVNRAEAEAKVKVQYVGDPEFKPIEQTSLQYATNTPEKVIKYGDLYYLCFQGVWFISTHPAGPWKTCDSVPQEIYTIPPSSPVHNVTYVTISNPTTATVQCDHTAGYMGMFLAGTAVGLTIAYGSGWYYPPYYYWGPMYPYPIYRPWPVTYGVAARYNPYTGGYYVGRAAYGPYGAVRSSAWYNPATGRYGRAASAQTWYGGRTAARAYNPYTGAYGATRQGHSPYAQWGSSVVTRGGDWARSGHITTAGGTVGGIRTSGGASAIVGTGHGGSGFIGQKGNNVYAGKDGNVYRKDSSGNWSKYDGGSWNQVQNPGNRPTPAQQSSTRNAATATTQQRSGTQAKPSVTPSTQARPASRETAQVSSTARPAQSGVSQPRPAVPSDTMDRLNRESQSRQWGDQRVSQQRQYERSGGWSGRGGTRSGGIRAGGGGRRR
jgi:hypothetical protein